MTYAQHTAHSCPVSTPRQVESAKTFCCNNQLYKTEQGRHGEWYKVTTTRKRHSLSYLPHTPSLTSTHPSPSQSRFHRKQNNHHLEPLPGPTNNHSQSLAMPVMWTKGFGGKHAGPSHHLPSRITLSTDPLRRRRDCRQARSAPCTISLQHRETQLLPLD